MIKLYGIPNCDKVRAACRWLEQRALPYQFHDFRRDGLTREQVERWYNSAGEKLINRRSTSWRNLSAQQQASGTKELLNLVVQQPTLIQRPVLEMHDRLAVNFAPDQYAIFFEQGL